jgi:hypothetical protein
MWTLSIVTFSVLTLSDACDEGHFAECRGAKYSQGLPDMREKLPKNFIFLPGTFLEPRQIWQRQAGDSFFWSNVPSWV